MSSVPRGVPDLPMLNFDDPRSDWPFLRDWLLQLRQSFVAGQPSIVVPRSVSNVTVTAQGFANLIQFTRSDGDYYLVYWNTTPDFRAAQFVDIGNSNQYWDSVGQTGVTRYYWVVAARRRSGAQPGQAGTDLLSNPVGPFKSTTLASGTGVNPPNPPPPGTQGRAGGDPTLGRKTFPL